MGKRNTEIKNKMGYDQFTAALYETMTVNDPKQYQKVKAFAGKKRGEMDENADLASAGDGASV